MIYKIGPRHKPIAILVQNKRGKTHVINTLHLQC